MSIATFDSGLLGSFQAVYIYSLSGGRNARVSMICMSRVCTLVNLSKHRKFLGILSVYSGIRAKLLVVLHATGGH